VSFEERSVRHALMAISAVYEEEFMTGETYELHARTSALEQLALDYYNRAIRSMVKKMKESDSIIVPVIGCLLFVCLEFLRQDVPRAIQHIDSGIKMIEQARLRKKNPLPSRRPHPPYEMEQIERVVAPIFSSINVTAITFGRPGVYFYSEHGEPESSPLIAGPIRTIEEVLTSFLDLANAGVRFLHETQRRRYIPGELGPDDFARQKKILDMFDSWTTKLNVLEKAQSEYWVSDIARKKKTILKILNLTMILCVSTTCSVYETSWDKHKSEFEELLGYAEQVIDNDSLRFEDTQSQLFSFELGILPALELIARKCRYPKLRRQALSILRKSPKKECLLDSKFILALDERIMELEEANMKLESDQIELDNDQLPSEESRIHLAYFAYEEVQELRGWPVRFLSKPHGPSEEWHIREDILQINRLVPHFTEPITYTKSNYGTAPYYLDSVVEKVVDIPMVRPMDWPVVQMLTSTVGGT
jgi:hypothetical protein